MLSAKRDSVSRLGIGSISDPSPAAREFVNPQGGHYQRQQVPVSLANEITIQFPRPAVGDILFFEMFGTHCGMNVMPYLMEKDMPEGDLSNDVDPRTSGGFEAQQNPVYAKFNIGQRIVPPRMIAAKNS